MCNSILGDIGSLNAHCSWSWPFAVVRFCKLLWTVNQGSEGNSSVCSQHCPPSANTYPCFCIFPSYVMYAVASSTLNPRPKHSNTPEWNFSRCHFSVGHGTASLHVGTLDSTSALHFEDQAKLPKASLTVWKAWHWPSRRTLAYSVRATPGRQSLSWECVLLGN